MARYVEEPDEDAYGAERADEAIAATAEQFCNLLTDEEMAKIGRVLSARPRELFSELFLACAERHERRQRLRSPRRG